MKSQHERSLRASPLARRLARQVGADLALVAETGPEGRVAEADVQALTPDTNFPNANSAPERIMRSLRRWLRNVVWGILGTCVHFAARRLFHPGYLHAGMTAYVFNMASFAAAAVLVWGVRWRDP